MKIAEELREISATADAKKRLVLMHRFKEKIRGHKEENILTICVNAAVEGEYKTPLKPCHFPEELTEEGLTFDTFWGNLFVCWDM